MNKNVVLNFETDSQFDDFSATFSLEEIDDWKTSASLAEIAIAKINEYIKGWSARLFAYVNENREYRELDQEGISSIPEESLFIACLAMKDSGSSLIDFFNEYQINEPLLEQLLTEIYQARWILPIVHRFRLLGFILLSHPDSEAQLKQGDHEFLSQLSVRLKTNLYAAMVADERQRNLLELAEFPQRLRTKNNSEELLQSILDELGREIPFDIAVYYAYDEYRKLLVPYSWRGLETAPPQLPLGKGISGITLDRKRAIAVSDRNRHPSFAVLEEEDFIQGSFVSAPLLTDRKTFGVITICRKAENGNEYGVEQRYTLEIAASFLASEIDSRLVYDELERSYFSTITALTKALEAKDEYTQGHSYRVMQYSEGIGQNLGLSSDSIRRIRYAAMLHDIGKIGISDSIINKPEKLTEDEFIEIKRHTEIGYEIVDDSDFLAGIRDLIRYHHEKIDGTGYYGKAAGDYPWEAMIISIADIYDALTSDRPYRTALDKVQALKSLSRLVGVHFDEAIFIAFSTYLEVDPEQIH